MAGFGKLTQTPWASVSPKRDQAEETAPRQRSDPPADIPLTDSPHHVLWGCSLGMLTGALKGKERPLEYRLGSRRASQGHEN